MHIPKKPETVLERFESHQLRDVMVYLGSDDSVKERMVCSGTINSEDAELLKSISGELRSKVLAKIFAALQVDE